MSHNLTPMSQLRNRATPIRNKGFSHREGRPDRGTGSARGLEHFGGTMPRRCRALPRIFASASAHGGGSVFDVSFDRRRRGCYR